MKLGKILNQELNNAIASMGHGDLMIVCDAGFPIPRDAWRIDLAITENVPDLKMVLELINSDMYAEKVVWANEVGQFNPNLEKMLREMYADREVETIPTDIILNEMPTKAKCIVRSGAFNPWGNILLYSGIDAPKWFNRDGRITPPNYQSRVGG